MFKIIISILLLLSILTSCNKSENKKNYKDELNPYVNYLNKDHKTAKEYILNLFKKNDLVIICERDHRENTQYKLIKELISDPDFIQNVGTIFTEVGMRNLNPKINDFIHSSGLSETEINNRIISLQRKASYYPLWEMYNFNYFTRTIYNVNQKLKQSEKINLYPTDVALDLKSLNIDYLKEFWENKVDNRDSLMANYIIKKFKIIKNSKIGRKKALIIMNFRHSFNNNFKQPNGKNFDNVGRFLFNKYQGKIANVLINPLGILEANSDIDISWTALQDGKWDASFKACKKDNIGFDFEETPFGKDHFDYWSFYPHKYNYQDIFNGFVYYKSPSEFKIITGVNGLIDNSFLETYKKRVTLWENIVGNRLGNPTLDSIIFKEYNKMNISKKEKIDTISLQINKWLK